MPGVDASARLAQAAAGLIEDGLLNEVGIEDLAHRLGVTDRHLRRVFQSEFGVSPVEFAQTQRLLLAKRLLTDTIISVTNVALASGFGSLRRFNTLFKQRYRINPSTLRKAVDRPRKTDVLEFQLGYRSPFDWNALISFLGKRAIHGVEYLDGKRYLRTVRIEHAGNDTLRLDFGRPRPAQARSKSADVRFACRGNSALYSAGSNAYWIWPVIPPKLQQRWGYWPRTTLDCAFPSLSTDLKRLCGPSLVSRSPSKPQEHWRDASQLHSANP
jgi:AraC-like DNA-binding protein